MGLINKHVNGGGAGSGGGYVPAILSVFGDITITAATQHYLWPLRCHCVGLLPSLTI